MTLVVGNIVSATTYNQVQEQINTLIQGDYGYISPTPTTAVTTGSIITLVEWDALYTEVTRCYIHQYNTLIPGIEEPSSYNLISAQLINILSTQSLALASSKYTVHPSQLEYVETQDTRDNLWNTGINSSLVYSWSSIAALDQYLTLGGRVEVDISYPDLDYSSEPDDLIWAELLDSIQAELAIQGNYFDRSHGTYREVSAGHPSGNTVSVTWTRVDNEINILVDLTYNASTSISVLPTATYRNYFSVGTNGPSPYGVPAPRFNVTGNSFDLAAIAPPNTRLLIVSTDEGQSLSYDFAAFSNSEIKTITITNVGNSTVTVTGYENPNVSFITNSIGGTLSIPGTIPAGQSRTITLNYASTNGQIGIFNTVFRLFSNNQQGTVSVPIKQIVTIPAFNVELSLENWTTSTTTLNQLSQFFIINSSIGTEVNYYTIELTDYHNGSLSVSTASNFGPTVAFNPIRVNNGNYLATLTVNAVWQSKYGVFYNSASAVLDITKNVSAYNLGTWKSAAGINNSIVGFSYDVIDNVRYLTMGFGAGVDNAPVVSPGGGHFYTSVDNLGVNADSNYQTGVALYKTEYRSEYTSFLNKYGVWVSSNSSAPTGLEQIRSYIFNVAQSGTYNWMFSVDTNGYFAINGQTLAERRGSGSVFNYTGQDSFVDNSGVIELSAGSNIVTFGVTNFFKGAVGIRIWSTQGDQKEVWNTLVPVRADDPYLYWAEVFRIPLTQGAETYFTTPYVVKNTGHDRGKLYSLSFGNGSLCNVTDDGNGNLDINFFANTVEYNFQNYSFSVNDTHRSTLYAPWYYVLLAEANRVTQLETPPPPGGLYYQTRFFIGFDSQGNVRTSLSAYPGFVAPRVPEVKPIFREQNIGDGWVEELPGPPNPEPNPEFGPEEFGPQGITGPAAVFGLAEEIGPQSLSGPANTIGLVAISPSTFGAIEETVTVTSKGGIESGPNSGQTSGVPGGAISSPVADPPTIISFTINFGTSPGVTSGPSPGVTIGPGGLTGLDLDNGDADTDSDSDADSDNDAGDW